MGTVLASKIAGACAKDMFDPRYVRFSEDTWLEWINDGQNEASILKPDIYTVNRDVQLAAGIKQSLASDETMFVRLINNMGTDGTTEGSTINTVDLEHFTLRNPDFPTYSAAATVEVCMFDGKDPKTFYVCPPQPSSSRGYVRKVVCAVPPVIAAIGDPIGIDDIYEHVLRNYSMHRAHTENAKHDIDAEQQAVKSWNMFVTALGRRDLVEKVYSPNTKRKQDKTDAS